jgi:hypothetical protein
VSLLVRTRPPGCITDLMFDAWFARELPDELEPAMEMHVATCPRCRGRRATLAVERSAFLALHPSYVATPGQVARKHKRALLGVGVITALVAVTLAALAHESAPDALPPSAAEATLGFQIERGGASELAARGQDLHPGDQVRFVYSLQAPAYLAIYGLDEHGTVRVLYPESELAAPARAGEHVALASTVKVDESLGQHWIFGLFCTTAFPVVEPQRTLMLQRSMAPSPGCDLSVTDWENTGL